MSKYENETIGKIVIIKNIIFKDRVTKKKGLDHAWEFGRPCLIIYSDNEYDYFVTITSKQKKEKYKIEHFILENEHFIPTQISRYTNYNLKKSKSKTIEGSVTLSTIYKIPISGHEEIGKITFETYKTIIENLKTLYQSENLDELITKAQSIGGR